MAHRHTKKCSVLSVVKEMQIESGHHVTPTRMAVVRKSTVSEDAEKPEPSHPQMDVGSDMASLKTGRVSPDSSP